MSKSDFESKNDSSEKTLSENLLEEKSTPEIRIVFYTDPICIWSWAFEPHWMRLVESIGGQVQFNIKMGGLVYPEAQLVHSPFRSSKEAIIFCEQVVHQTGVEYAPTLWLTNDVQSSYPSCIAFNSVVEEGFESQIRFLRRLRQEYHIFGRNFMIEKDFHDLIKDLRIDLRKFQSFWQSGKAYNEFLVSLASNNAQGIHSFPTISAHTKGKTPVFFHGYHHFHRIKLGLSKAFPKLIWNPAPDFEYLLKFYQPLTGYEIIQIYDLTPELLPKFISKLEFEPIQVEIENIKLFYHPESSPL